jgi:tetratricopeptide (TPR) repeat protein
MCQIVLYLILLGGLVLLTATLARAIDRNVAALALTAIGQPGQPQTLCLRETDRAPTRGAADSQQLYFGAVRAVACSDFVGAVALLESLSEQTAQSATLLAMALWRSGEEQRAVAIIDRYYPGGRWHLVMPYAKQALQADERRRAAALLDDYLGPELALPITSEKLSLYEAASAIYLEAGRYRDAERQARALVAVSPSTDVFWVRLGKAQLALQEFAGAEESTHRAVTIRANASNIFHHGLAWQGLGNHEAAQSEFERALALDPNYAPVRFQLALQAYEQGDLATAGQHLRYILAHSQDQRALGDATKLLALWHIK